MNPSQEYGVKRLRVGAMVTLPPSDSETCMGDHQAGSGNCSTLTHQPSTNGKSHVTPSPRKPPSNLDMTYSSFESPSVADTAFCFGFSPAGLDGSWIEENKQNFIEDDQTRAHEDLEQDTKSLVCKGDVPVSKFSQYPSSSQQVPGTQSNCFEHNQAAASCKKREVTERKFSQSASGSSQINSARCSEIEKPFYSSKELEEGSSSLQGAEPKSESFSNEDFPALHEVTARNRNVKVRKTFKGNAQKHKFEQTCTSEFKTNIEKSTESASQQASGLESSFQASVPWSDVLKSGLKTEVHLPLATVKDIEEPEKTDEKTLNTSFDDFEKVKAFCSDIQHGLLGIRSRASSLLQSAVSQCSEYFEKNKTRSIVEGLKLSLKERYQSRFPWKEDFAISFHSLPISTIFNLSLESEDNSTRKIVTDDQLLPNLQKTDLLNIVTFGEPNSGKSTICTWLAFNCTNQDFFYSKYTLCVYVHVSELKFAYGVSEALETFLCGILNNNDEKSVHTALKSIAQSLLFIIDGYDELSPVNQRKMDRFLCDRKEFRQSTVFVATRPVANESFRGKFDYVMRLGGFSFNHLLLLLKQTYVSKIRTDTFVQRFGEDSRMLYLEELSPFYLTHVHQLVATYNYFPEEDSNVWSLLEGVRRLLAKKFLQGTAQSQIIFLKLGKLMFEALAIGYASFTEELLRKIFLDDFNLLKKWHVFHQDREQSYDLWKVSSKVLMVFYATFYLRYRWNKLKNLDDRQLFLNELFCLGDCSGNYVFGQTEGTRACFYVGLLPEIVLVVNGDFSLKEAKFEMFYDTERIEHSQAFDSVNLLDRVGERHRTRFGFKELESDDPVVEVFEDIFNSLSLSDLCVDYKLYFNTFENTLFLTVALTDENDEVLLRCVCRTGGRLNRTHVEFDFSIFETVFGFLSKTLSHSMKGFELEDSLVNANYIEFIFYLLNSMVKSRIGSAVTVDCYDYENCLSVTNHVNYSIFKCSNTAKIKVRVRSTYNYPDFRSEVCSYEPKAFLGKRESLMNHLQDWYNTTRKPALCVNIY